MIRGHAQLSKSRPGWSKSLVEHCISKINFDFVQRSLVYLHQFYLIPTSYQMLHTAKNRQTLMTASKFTSKAFTKS